HRHDAVASSWRAAASLIMPGIPHASSPYVSCAHETHVQSLPVQRTPLVQKKPSIFANRFAVEVDFSTAVIRALDAYHIPVNLAPVPIVRFFVSLPRREMKRAGDFLIEQYVAHRLEHARIKAE